MDERMRQAAESGEINALHQLIEADGNILDHIDQVPSIQNPLHIAALAGHIQFAMKMMELKPSFARKLNPYGFSPIHLALKNGHIELVRQLLEIDRDLAHVKGDGCITPLHCVVETGDLHIDLLNKFLLVCPNSIVDVTVQGETTLHIALKRKQHKAFKFLVGWLIRNLFINTSLDVSSILNQKDYKGNTVLHIAVLENETQVVCQLLTCSSRFVDVNSTNLEGKTAWDISQGQIQVDNREIRLMLYSARASASSSLSTVTRSDDNNIDEFYKVIGEDVKLLEHIDELPFINTPLHIAASYGNTQFALEMMSLKPSFARKLDPNGFSPIHLALQNSHIELVRQLLQLDGDLVRVKGRERLTPLHYVVENYSENLDLLEEFLLVCPDSITDVTVQNKTALHIALKYDKLKNFNFMVEWLARNCTQIDKFKVRTILNWKDNDGNTVLHIAVSKNQTQAVIDLLAWSSSCSSFVGVNHKNKKGQTAWDILKRQTREVDNREIEVMLWSRMGWLSKLGTINHLSLYIKREIRSLSEERRSMLLVVAVLVVTISFQAMLSPPGGVWQDNGQCINTTEVGSSHNGTIDQTPFNTTVGSSNDPVTIHLTRSNTTLVCEHKAGTAIALEDSLFWLFLFCNSLVFGISNSLIVLLVLNGRIKFLFLGLNLCLCYSYFYSVKTIIDDEPQAFAYACTSAFFSLVAVFHSNHH